MEKLRVLFLTYCYPPQKYPRSIQISHLVRHLSSEIDLTVLTSEPTANGDQSLLNFTSLDNVKYAPKSCLTKFIEQSKGYKIKKEILPDFQYPWHFDLFKQAIPLIEKNNIDIIVTFGQPMSTHIAGFKLKKKFPNLKWLAHFSDPWVDNIFNEYNFFTKCINQHYQNMVFEHADKLIFSSQETIDLVLKKYTPNIQLKSVSLPHTFDENLYCVPCKEKQENNLLHLRYIGNFYGIRQPDCLLEALSLLPKNQLSEIRVDFVGAATTDVTQKIRSFGLEKIVTTTASVSYLDSLSLMQESDLLLIIDAPTDISPFLPSKLIDYIGANKPIFGITPSGAAQELIEEMGFMVANPNNPKEIAQKLSKIISDLKRQKIQEIPSHIRERYLVKVVGERMKDLLQEVRR